jgi:AAA domain
MFTSLKLTNFRKHTDREINFLSDFNVLRGNNEHGKTTVSEAIAYAMFGVSSLRTSLDETVTYGKPVSSLRVDLVVSIDGVDYHVSRGKSGAEIRYGDQHVTGQTETKAFMERLLGTSSQMAGKLLFANQTEIRGILAQGPAAASSLIETLANLQVLETLVEKIQDQLPCGNTTALSGQLSDLRAKADAPAPDAPSRELADAADQHVSTVADRLSRMESNLSSLKESWVQATEDMQEARQALLNNERVAKRRAVLEQVSHPDDATVSQETLDNLIRQVAQETTTRELYDASQIVFPDCPRFDGTVAEFEAAKQTANWDNIAAQEALQNIMVSKAQAEAKRISDDVCPLCKQDLSMVPEVVASNLKIDEELDRLEQMRLDATEQLTAARSLCATYADMEADDRRIRRLMTPHWKAGDTMPVTPQWVHGVIEKPGNTKSALTDARLAVRGHQEAMAKWDAAQSEMSSLVEVPVIDTTKAEVAISAYEEAKRIVEQERGTLADAKVHAAKEAAAFAIAKAAYDRQVLDRASLAEQIEKTKTMIETMTHHNDLVKKLRAARPVIANKLWTTVLGTVGHYFSQVRGTRSMVTRDSDGFKVDGQGVGGLSGSTLDALGLALRLALVKTFVPTASFLALDEPAAACDSTRELAMLGTIAGAGFEQVLLVTHSDLADSFATQVIQL